MPLSNSQNTQAVDQWHNHEFLRNTHISHVDRHKTSQMSHKRFNIQAQLSMTKHLTFQASQVGTQAKKILLILSQRSVSTRPVSDKCSVWAVLPQQMLWQSSLRAPRPRVGLQAPEASGWGDGHRPRALGVGQLHQPRLSGQPRRGM